MNKKQFVKFLNASYGEKKESEIREELFYLVETKKLSEPTFRIYIRYKQIGTMLQRLDPEKLNEKFKNQYHEL